MAQRKKKSTIETEKNQVLAFLKSRTDRGASVESILRELKVDNASEYVFVDLMLEELQSQNKIKYDKGRFLYLNPDQIVAKKLLIGKLDLVNQRFGFVRYDDTDADIFIDADELNGALHGDTVKVKIISHKKRNGKNPEGSVTEIVERGRDTIVGKIKIKGSYGLINPDNKGFFEAFFVAKASLNGAIDNDKVIAKIIEYPSFGAQGLAEVKEVLGQSGNNTAEMHAIMAEFDLPVHFPKDVEEEAESISTEISVAEIKQRRDFRKTLTFTIDPHDAKDFDDAISYKKLENGNLEIGVHIADVAHYVIPGSALDKEAIFRATSVYLVDRTIPMLPEKLSNGLCSLRPHEDKLVFSAVFEVNEMAEVQNQWFGRSIIHSDRRFSYEEAQEILEKENEKDTDYGLVLKDLNDLAIKLRTERFRKGAFNFETNEVKFQLDESGKPIGVYHKIRKDAHKLIEEFMLLANKQVAHYVAHIHESKKQPDPYTMVYRVHEPPNPSKIETFATFAAKLGYTIKTGSKNQLSSSLNSLMSSIEGTPLQNTLESLAVRTMSKARYSCNNLGHFGLAFDFYSHFTSPIRRYPDVMAHRLLALYLAGEKSQNEEVYEQLCKQSSEREKVAAEAERASIKYKQVEFMSYQSRNEEFEGLVSGITDFGLFVEIKDTGCEGMVRFADIKGDYFEYDSDNYRLIGRKSNTIIGFGAEVKVKILATDLQSRSMDLQLVSVGKTLFNNSPIQKTSFDRNNNKRGRRDHSKNKGGSGKRRR
jgi:ribonuclease R